MKTFLSTLILALGLSTAAHAATVTYTRNITSVTSSDNAVLTSLGHTPGGPASLSFTFDTNNVSTLPAFGPFSFITYEYTGTFTLNFSSASYTGTGVFNLADGIEDPGAIIDDDAVGVVLTPGSDFLNALPSGFTATNLTGGASVGASDVFAATDFSPNPNMALFDQYLRTLSMTVTDTNVSPAEEKTISFSLTTAVVPLPASMGFAVFGVLALGAVARRRRT